MNTSQNFVPALQRSAQPIARGFICAVLFVHCLIASAATPHPSQASSGPATTPLAFQLLAAFSFSDDGSQPGSLIEAADGSLYGTSSGAINPWHRTNGLVFKLYSSGQFMALASFPPLDTNGFSPRALVQAADGNFYGATAYRGQTPICGTIFRLTPTGDRTNIFYFGPSQGCSARVLVAGSDGNLYGLAGDILFKLTLAGQFTALHTFGETDYSRTALLEGTDGNLYGAYGPSVFRLSREGAFSVLASVSNPEALVQGADGNFYGTDALGGDGFGSVFRLTPAGVLTTLASFHGTNGVDAGLLIQGRDGHLYGVTEYGGPDWTGELASGSGTIFQVTLDGKLTTLAHSLPRADGLSVNGAVQASDGNLYFALESEFPDDAAGIFRLVPQPVLTEVRHSEGQDVLTWTSFAGGVYKVEHKTAFSFSDWTALPLNITATAGTVSATNTVGPSREGYYRVSLLP